MLLSFDSSCSQELHKSIANRVIFGICGVLNQPFAQVFGIGKGKQGGKKEVDPPKSRIAHVIEQAVLGLRCVTEEGLHNKESHDFVVTELPFVLGFAFAIFPLATDDPFTIG